MQAYFYELNRELNGIHKIFSRVEGNTDCFNDVIVFRRPEETKAKFNLIFFGGDVQVVINNKLLFFNESITFFT